MSNTGLSLTRASSARQYVRPRKGKRASKLMRRSQTYGKSATLKIPGKEFGQSIDAIITGTIQETRTTSTKSSGANVNNSSQASKTSKPSKSRSYQSKRSNTQQGRKWSARNFLSRGQNATVSFDNKNKNKLPGMMTRLESRDSLHSRSSRTAMTPRPAGAQDQHKLAGPLSIDTDDNENYLSGAETAQPAGGITPLTPVTPRTPVMKDDYAQGRQASGAYLGAQLGSPGTSYVMPDLQALASMDHNGGAGDIMIR